MVAWLLSNQKDSGTTQNGSLYKVVTLHTYVSHTRWGDNYIYKHMHGCMSSGMDVCIYSLGEEAEEERKVIGPQGIPVQGANKAG